MTGPELVRLMRQHKVTIRELSKRTKITMKRIRQRRATGLKDGHTIRDWKQAILGYDPGRCCPATCSCRCKDTQWTGGSTLATAMEYADKVRTPECEPFIVERQSGEDHGHRVVFKAERGETVFADFFVVCEQAARRVA